MILSKYTRNGQFRFHIFFDNGQEPKNELENGGLGVQEEIEDNTNVEVENADEGINNGVVKVIDQHDEVFF